jgi:HEAT repeat protein
MTRLAALVLLAAITPAAVADPPKVPPPELDPQVQEAVRVLREGTPAEQLRAVRTLKGLGPRAASVIPTLVTVAHQPRIDRDVFNEVVNAVAALGEPGNPDIIRLCLASEYYGGRRGRSGKASVAAPFTDYIARHAADTFPVVTDLLTDPDLVTRRRAAVTLALLSAPREGGKPSVFAGLPAAVGERTVRGLREALEQPDLPTRAWAAAALTDADPASLPRTVPAVLAATWQHTDAPELTQSLVRAGGPAARVVIDYLDDPNPDRRRSAVHVLIGFGDVALPALADGLRHPNPRVRDGVVQAVRDGGNVPRLRSGLMARLTDPDSRVRLRAADALTTDEPAKAGPAVPVLTEFLFDRDRIVRVDALTGLIRLGPAARPAVTALLRRIGTGDPDTRFLAAEALAGADRSTWRAYVPVFVAALKNADSPYRLRAIRGLETAGRAATPVVPALRERFADPELLLRVTAAEAVARLDPAAVPDVVRCLAAILSDPGEEGPQSRRSRRAAMRALDRIGPPAREAVPALLELVYRDPNSGMAPEAAVIAVRLDPDHAREAYDLFRVHLSPGHPDPDDDWLSRLSDLKGLAKPLVPDLIAALGSKNATQREVAMETLAMLGPDAKAALPALRELAKGTQNAKSAAEAIRTIEKK